MRGGCHGQRDAGVLHHEAGTAKMSCRNGLVSFAVRPRGGTVTQPAQRQQAEMQSARRFDADHGPLPLLAT